MIIISSMIISISISISISKVLLRRLEEGAGLVGVLSRGVEQPNLRDDINNDVTVLIQCNNMC